MLSDLSRIQNLPDQLRQVRRSAILFLLFSLVVLRVVLASEIFGSGTCYSGPKKLDRVTYRYLHFGNNFAIRERRYRKL